jgi:hypothetical protein
MGEQDAPRVTRCDRARWRDALRITRADTRSNARLAARRYAIRSKPTIGQLTGQIINTSGFYGALIPRAYLCVTEFCGRQSLPKVRYTTREPSAVEFDARPVLYQLVGVDLPKSTASALV